MCLAAPHRAPPAPNRSPSALPIPGPRTCAAQWQREPGLAAGHPCRRSGGRETDVVPVCRAPNLFRSSSSTVTTTSGPHLVHRQGLSMGFFTCSHRCTGSKPCKESPAAAFPGLRPSRWTLTLSRWGAGQAPGSRERPRPGAFIWDSSTSN